VLNGLLKNWQKYKNTLTTFWQLKLHQAEGNVIRNLIQKL
jgi:hypothetical protein